MRSHWITLAGLSLAGMGWTLLAPMPGSLSAQQAAKPKGATAASLEETCGDCHGKAIKAYRASLHGKLFRDHPRGDSERTDCESCHGPLQAHADSPSDLTLLPSLRRERQPDAKIRSAACLNCHQTGMQFDVAHSRHQKAGIACGDCHLVMRPESGQKLLHKAESDEVCRGCHLNIASQSAARSTHVAPNSGLGCIDCHNPHSGERAALKLDTVNETCASCHRTQAGPFLFEHAPAASDCMNCHAPHGAAQPALLKMNVDSLCLSCHSQAPFFHVQTGLTRYTLARGCANCHPMVHGSNHATGNRLLR